MEAAIFANTKRRAEELYERLLLRGGPSEPGYRSSVVHWWDIVGLPRHLESALAQGGEGWGEYDARKGWTISRQWLED